jgi:hypothetical protein
MMIGQAAGVAAAMAIRGGKAPQEIDVAELQKTLKSQGAVFEYMRSPQQDAFDQLRKQMTPAGPTRINREQ